MNGVEEQKDEKDSWSNVSVTKNVILSKERNKSPGHFIRINNEGFCSDNLQKQSLKPIIVDDSRLKKFSTEQELRNVKMSSIRQQALIGMPNAALNKQPE